MIDSLPQIIQPVMEIALKGYCGVVARYEDTNVHRHYHDNEYGFPLQGDDELFARLVLEINQAGLSWDTILKKKAHFFTAYDNFNIATVASYGPEKIAALLADAGIIRNRLKVNAAIVNAQKILELQQQYGSFRQWIEHHHPLTKEEWVKLFKKHFKFTGGEIVNEFLMSTGYLPGAHDANCPVFKQIAELKPAWMG
jgi:DNA-3-methyladenine glycosylase I